VSTRQHTGHCWPDPTLPRHSKIQHGCCMCLAVCRRTSAWQSVKEQQLPQPQLYSLSITRCHRLEPAHIHCHALPCVCVTNNAQHYKMLGCSQKRSADSSHVKIQQRAAAAAAAALSHNTRQPCFSCCCCHTGLCLPPNTLFQKCIPTCSHHRLGRAT
jgi:hypothetical protein